MSKRKYHVYYVRCLDDKIKIENPIDPFAFFAMSYTFPMLSNTGQIKPTPEETKKAIEAMRFRIEKCKIVTAGHCYKATLFLKEPLSKIQLLETDRGTLSRKLVNNSGMIRHGVFFHSRFERITEDEYNQWLRSKKQ